MDLGDTNDVIVDGRVDWCNIGIFYDLQQTFAFSWAATQKGQRNPGAGDSFAPNSSSCPLNPDTMLKAMMSKGWANIY